MQPLTGCEIQQLSMHDVLERRDRCWCCGKTRKVVVINSKLVEVCWAKSGDIDNRYKCRYSVGDYDADGNITTCFCLTPYTDSGNCNGTLSPEVTLIEFFELLDVYYNSRDGLNVFYTKENCNVVREVYNCIKQVNNI